MQYQRDNVFILTMCMCWECVWGVYQASSSYGKKMIMAMLLVDLWFFFLSPFAKLEVAKGKFTNMKHLFFSCSFWLKLTNLQAINHVIFVFHWTIRLLNRPFTTLREFLAILGNRKNWRKQYKEINTYYICACLHINIWCIYFKYFF